MQIQTYYIHATSKRCLNERIRKGQSITAVRVDKMDGELATEVRDLPDNASVALYKRSFGSRFLPYEYGLFNKKKLKII